MGRMLQDAHEGLNYEETALFSDEELVRPISEPQKGRIRDNTAIILLPSASGTLQYTQGWLLRGTLCFAGQASTYG